MTGPCSDVCHHGLRCQQHPAHGDHLRYLEHEAVDTDGFLHVWEDDAPDCTTIPPADLATCP